MTDQKTKQGKAPQSSLGFNSNNFPQLNGNSTFPKPALNDIVKDFSHTSRPIILVQGIAKTDKNHHFKNENPKSINVLLV